MTIEDVNAAKAESAKDIAKVYASHIVKITKEILYLQQDLEALSKKKKRSADEEKRIVEHESDIRRAKEDLAENEAKLEIMRSLIETYSKNETVKL